MKKILVSLILLFITSFSIGDTALSSYSSIGSLNTLHLGWAGKDNSKLAKVISSFDLICLQEVMSEHGIKQVEKEVEKITGKDWDYLLSPYSVGERAYREYYGFLWKKEKVKLLKDLGFYPEKNKNDFTREPYGAIFKIGNMDITLVTCHLVYGDNIKERRSEADKLYDVYNYFQSINNEEQDVIILGDFNLKGTDKSFFRLKSIDQIRNIFYDHMKTTLNKEGELVSAYDNIFVSKYTTEKEIETNFVLYQHPLREYRKISDHLPVGIIVNTGKDDD